MGYLGNHRKMMVFVELQRHPCQMCQTARNQAVTRHITPNLARYLSPRGNARRCVASNAMINS